MKIFGEDVISPVFSTATKTLFEVREDAEQQSDKKGDISHSVVEKPFFLVKGSRTYLETSVGFLRTVA